MKPLLDENISHRLLGVLESICPGSTHVRLIGLQRASDDAIWQYALDHRFCIVSQDSDFLERALVRGTPPAVICLRGGNTSTRNLRQVFASALPDVIQQLEKAPSPQIWELVHR